MIARTLEARIRSEVDRQADGSRHKAIIVMGARQVGKTTTLHKLFDGSRGVLWLNGDEPDVIGLLSQASSSRLRAVIGDNRTLVIDEAQRIPDIGTVIKLITDYLPDIQLIATGSSSFELANRVNEPLTGRKVEFTMYPLSFQEMVEHHGLLEEVRLLPHRLVYGYYPEVVTSAGNEQPLLRELSDSYLFRDILIWGAVKKSDRLVRLLQALALQVGSQVSYPELGRLSGLDAKTVESYITLLEQSYIVFRLGSFSRNLRSELKRSRKVYFYDNGIRNAILANFSQVESRTDIGQLWENYLVSERRKALLNHGVWANSWFWRTTSQSEIDLVEEKGGRLQAYEFKWGSGARAKPPKAFLTAYPESGFDVITRDDFEGFLMPGDDEATASRW